MSVVVVYESHAISEDNENGIATGWLPGRLSETGCEQARMLGEQRRLEGFAAVLTSDLSRALDTATIAFGASGVPVLADWRLRECDYGDWNGRPGSIVHGAGTAHLHRPYPGGESWEGAVARVVDVLPEIAARWGGQRILLIGHRATRWALELAVNGASLEKLLECDFDDPESKVYELPTPPRQGVPGWHRNSGDTGARENE